MNVTLLRIILSHVTWGFCHHIENGSRCRKSRPLFCGSIAEKRPTRQANKRWLLAPLPVLLSEFNLKSCVVASALL